MKIEDIKVPAVVYPRFLGTDAHGSDVYELADGRWTWGDDPHVAQRRTRTRTFTPADYIAKYGRPSATDEERDVKAESELDPAEVAALYAVAKASVAAPADLQHAKRQVLLVLRAVLDDWIRGVRANHEAMDHRNENVGEECWRTFGPDDIRVMINDAARELGLEPLPAPDKPEEDKR